MHATITDDPTPAHQSIVALRATQVLRQTFDKRGHRPSPEQFSALVDLINTFDMIVRGEAEDVVYLSSLDPGLGKTSSLKAYLDVMLSAQDAPHSTCGVLVALFTLEEIEAFIHDVGIPAEMLAVWTSDERLNRKGTADHTNARVLLTTHSRVEMELKGQPVWSTASLYYKGEPRRLRVWDEAFLPGRPISLSVDDVLATVRILRAVSPDLRNEVKAAFDQIEKVPDGSLFTLPDYMRSHNVNDLLGAVAYVDPRDQHDAKLQENLADIVSSLALVSGRTVRVHTDKMLGAATIDFEETFAPDIAPVVVLDASGRVRQTYRDMEVTRKSLRRLKTAAKSYRNLTVHVWQRGGGKASWKDQASQHDLLEGITRTILTKREERWLIVHHKAGRGVPDVQTYLRRVLKPEVFARLSFVNWGRHRATNAYQDIGNVILAGTLFLRPSMYRATKHVATGLAVHESSFTASEMYAFELGEHANDILQALCRGLVRRSIGDTCPECHAYVIASVRSGIPQAMPSIFPDCVVKPWVPYIPTFKGLAAGAFNVLKTWTASAKPDALHSFRDLATSLAVTPATLKDVRKRDDFVAAVSALGLVEWGANKYFTAYRKT
jgi:hypothetical protein